MFRKKLSKLICAVICAAVVCSGMPVSAAEISTDSAPAEEKLSDEVFSEEQQNEEGISDTTANESGEDAADHESIVDENTDADSTKSEDSDDAGDQKEDDAGEEEKVAPSVRYQAYVQDIGWAEEVSDGNVSGTTGKQLRMEGMKIWLNSDIQGGITYRSHVQSIGWQGWTSDGAFTGTQNKSYRMEAIQIKLTGEIASLYDVYYRVHVQSAGWLGWAKNGETAGTESSSLRVESVQILLAEKGTQPDLENSGLKPNYKLRFSYRSHVQRIGWEKDHAANEISGTVGQALRLEGFVMSLDSCVAGNIQYRAHVQNIGWQEWKTGNSLAGTVGQSLREEAIQLQLTGSLANVYDIYYRVHIQKYGWLDWAKNGNPAGSEGYGLRLEAIQVELVPKGSAAPGSTSNAFYKFRKFSNPCQNIQYISDEFGGRVSPGGIGSTNHKGRDYAAKAGTNILAAADGVVCESGYNRFRGYYIIVSHFGGFKTVYQHMPRCELGVGTKVSRGQVIGHVGSTGASTGPHLHFEVRVNDVPVDPRLYLE